MQVTVRFAAAASAFTDLVTRIGPDDWERPGLGAWSVRSLTGHAARALTTVVDYVQRPAPEREVPDTTAYFLAAHGHDAEVAARGVQAGVALGADPATAVAQLAAQATAAVDAATAGGADPVIHTAGGGMLLSDYLPTRCFELTVHSLDIAHACGIDANLDPGSIADAVDTALRVGIRTGNAETVLLALTGRADLPTGFTIL
ncbi:maleylpyruvate isomerase family mycothiol-dependent enzyme [Tersicoccus sp. MR15.9]|uniref:maleylpyruvate isomerase family mycothiol-dependent enzyme n=1 Tax=Tersicoccus mangrovi TaxID=3121635 RepID=UPI002FE69DF4